MHSFSNRFFRYFVAGGLAAIVDAGGFALLSHVGIEILVAASISFIVAAVVNYQISCRYVFNSKPIGNVFVKFLMIASLGMLVNVAITMAIIHSWAVLPVVAKVIAITITFIINFFLNNYIVFTNKTR